MRASGSYTVNASIDTGPLKGMVEQTLELNIDPNMKASK